MIYLCERCGAWMPGTIINLVEILSDGLVNLAGEMARAQGKAPPAPIPSVPNCRQCQSPMRLVTSSERLMLCPVVEAEPQEGHQG